MVIKSVNRNIPETRENSNDRFRVRYNNKSKFDLLVVNICKLKTTEIQTYKFCSTELPDKDSIHFSTSIENGKLKVHWQGISSSQINTKDAEPNEVIEDIKDKKEYDVKEINAFSPIFGERPKILILGTIPGKVSLKLNEYYANSRNDFWKIMYHLYNEKLESNHDLKIEFLKKNGISIWDICRSANRIRSLDSDIKNEIPNNIKDFIKSNPTIKTIAFNGQKAENLYDKYFERFENITYLTLLSTSPANTSYTFENKLKDWKNLIKPTT